MADLKSCPFCGCTNPVMLPRICNRDTPYDPADRAFPVVQCRGCHARVAGENWGRPETAVEAWNRREPPQMGKI